MEKYDEVAFTSFVFLLYYLFSLIAIHGFACRFPSVGRDNGRWIYLHLFPLVEQASRCDDFPLKYFVERLSWRCRVIACGIEIQIGIIACICFLESVERWNSEEIYLRKMRSFQKLYSGSFSYILVLWKVTIFKERKISFLKISTRSKYLVREIGKIEISKDSNGDTLASYFIPSLISHHPGHIHGGNRKKETQGIWWLVNRLANFFRGFYR